MIKFFFALFVVFAFILVVWANNTLKEEYRNDKPDDKPDDE